MLVRRSWIIFRREIREFVTRAPGSVPVFLVMPILFAAFLKPVARTTLISAGFHGVNGAEQVVPGMAVAMGTFLVQIGAFSFFGEYTWGTWDRLRASAAGSAEIMIGKSLAPFVIYLGMLGALFATGGLVLGLHIRGSLLGLALVAVALAVCLVSLGLALVAVSKSFSQFSVLQQLLAVILIGLGGTLFPLSALPAAIRVVAPWTPSYWAMRGFRSVILANGGIAGVLPSVGVLAVFASVFLIVAAARFRTAESKQVAAF